MYDIKNEYLYIALGRYLKAERKKRGISGEKLAKILNISQQQISRYERGNCNLNIGRLIKFIDGLGIDIDEVFQFISDEVKKTEVRPMKELSYFHNFSTVHDIL